MAEKTPLGDMPSMVPTRDEIRGRQPAEQNRKPGAARRAPKGGSGGGGSWVTVTLLLVSGVAIAGLALQQYSMSQSIVSYEERLDLANERIVTLEQSLTQTDESVSMNGTAINAQFQAIKVETDLQMTEIRKLWDVTNKRNRQWIEDNQALLATQKDSLDSLTTSLTTSLEMVEEVQARDEQLMIDLQGQASKGAAQIESLSSDVSAMDSALVEASRAIAAIEQLNYEEQFLTLTLTQENLLAEQGQFNQTQSENTQQVAQIQQAIQSIDVGRQETSQRLSVLLNQLANLEARFADLTGTTQ